MQELMGGNGGVQLHFHHYGSAHLGQSKQIGMIKHQIQLVRDHVYNKSHSGRDELHFATSD